MQRPVVTRPLAVIGLGRMGGNMSRRLAAAGQRVVVYDRDPEVARNVAALQNVQLADSIEALADLLEPPRIAWLMLPAGAATESTLTRLAALFEAGDILIDGGNSDYRETIRRSEQLAQREITLVDCGTSGGIWGNELGYCLMIGGPEPAVQECEPIFRTLAMTGGYAHVGPAGAGHFVKMIHNGIEYGLLQAYGEGFELLHASPFALDLQQVASLWNHGSVVRSWLLELLERAFQAQGPDLARVRGWVDDSGEGRWTVQTALDLNVPAPVITLSLLARLASRQEQSYSAQVIAALRNQFGGHATDSNPEDPVPG